MPQVSRHFFHEFSRYIEERRMQNLLPSKNKFKQKYDDQSSTIEIIQLVSFLDINETIYIKQQAQ